jgi:hypothetical protein
MAKIDPRADPLSNPPTSKDDFTVDRVEVPKPALTKALAATPTTADPPESKDEPASSVVRKGTPNAPPDDVVSAAPKKGAAPASADARFEKLEKLLDMNDWKAIAGELGSSEEVQAAKLPPNLELVAALAHNENAKDGDPEAARRAITAMASLLGVAEDSPIARVLARRMLRKNPVRFTERQAPAARTSLLIVIATLVIGGGVGWLASIGSWRGIAALLHL